MYNHILVAVDGSDVSEQALHEAIKMSKQHKAKLRIVHVVSEFYINYAGACIDYERLEKSFNDYGLKLLSQMEATAHKSNIECDSLLVEVKLPEERTSEKIIESAKAWPADLLVIGTHGRRGFHRLFLGSVAEEVIHIAPMPVLLIRCKQPKN
jgi:nucleotide-binding universal stress UspA family protein